MPTVDAETTQAPAKAIALDLEVRRSGKPVNTVRTVADPEDTTTLLQLLAAAVKRDGRSADEIANYELVVRPAGHQTSS